MKMNFRQFDLKLKHEWTIASTLKAGKTIFETVLLDLNDDDGVVGLGESAPSSRYKEDVRTVMAFLKNVDASRLSFEDVAGSMDYLETFPGNYAAKCAVNIALVDGAAKKAGKAIYDFLNLGFTEAVRAVTDAPDTYTFWDYQAGAWQKNNGIRIDHLLLSPEAADRFVSASVEKHVRAWEKPSDHVPVAIELSMAPAASA